MPQPAKNTTPTIPAPAFEGVRRRDHLARLACTTSYVALGIANSALMLWHFNGFLLSQPGTYSPLINTAFHTAGATACGLLAYGWGSATHAFNALRHGKPHMAVKRYEAQDNVASAIAMGGINLGAATFSAAPLVGAAIASTDSPAKCIALLSGVAATSLLARTAFLFGQKQDSILGTVNPAARCLTLARSNGKAPPSRPHR